MKAQTSSSNNHVSNSTPSNITTAASESLREENIIGASD
jgi:hypothetical protein